MSRFRYREQKKRSQPGFTLIEMVVALAVAAVILVSTVALGRYIVVATADQSDQVLARLQVQYVSFWIGEDVVQAQDVTIGNSTYYFLRLYSDTSPDPDGGEQWVEYHVEDMKDKVNGNLWRLYRKTKSGTTVVAEYLDTSLTRCYQKQSGNGTLLDVLVLDVTAKVDQRESSGTYEINPRAGTVTWVGGR